MPSPPVRRPPPPFRPSFALTMLYLFAFFLLYLLLLVLPELLRVLGEVPPGPEQQAIAHEVARSAARPRVLGALLLALGTVAAGAWLGVLPGLRRRG